MDSSSSEYTPLSSPTRPSSRRQRPRWAEHSDHHHRRRRCLSYVYDLLPTPLQRIYEHPYFPKTPLRIGLTALLLSIVISATVYTLIEHKEREPWRADCTAPSLFDPLDRFAEKDAYHVPNATEVLRPESLVFPPRNFDELAPAGVFIAVFSMDTSVERRMLIRSSWPGHPLSRNGVGRGDGGDGTSRTIVRFAIGRPRDKEWERKIQVEQEFYNDIIILPIKENMNTGKTHAYFSWAAVNAWVPPVYTALSSKPSIPLPRFSYSNESMVVTRVAAHDPEMARKDMEKENPMPWVRPDYVAKLDDDAFLMLAELEGRLRVQLHRPPSPPSPAHPHDASKPNRPEDDPLIYWGYLQEYKNHGSWMTGELYALSWSLVGYVASDERVKGMTKGYEDGQTAKWMRMHPRASEVRWTRERCWMYDHPRANTRYARGFLFPSEVSRVAKQMQGYLDDPSNIESETPSGGLWPPSWSYSTVSRYGLAYREPARDLDGLQAIEGLVEGSSMSKTRFDPNLSTDEAWRKRENRATRYEGKRLGGTVVVHFAKTYDEYAETILAFLGDQDAS